MRMVDFAGDAQMSIPGLLTLRNLNRAEGNYREAMAQLTSPLSSPDFQRLSETGSGAHVQGRPREVSEVSPIVVRARTPKRLLSMGNRMIILV